MTDDVIEIVFYYSKVEEKIYSKYTINYLDISTGKSIKEPKVVTNQEINTTIYSKSLIIDIANYTFDHFDKDSIIIKDDNNIINLYYIKKEEPKQEEPSKDQFMQEQAKQSVRIVTVRTSEDKPIVKDSNNRVHISNTGKSTYIDKILGITFIITGCIIIATSVVIDIRKRKNDK